MFVAWNSKFGMLKAWDAVTGIPISTIKGFAITDDFSTVASFENNAITLYNMDGSEQGAILTTSASVLEVAISSESPSRIAAGLTDRSVSLFSLLDTRDSQNGKPIGSFGDFEKPRYGKTRRLEFSATGARLAYLSAKKGVVKLWDVKGDPEFVADLDCGSGGFAFSRDGSRIASWSWSSGVKLWDCGDGQLVGNVAKSPVRTVAVSDNGSLLAICRNDNVEVWGGNRGNLSQVEDLDLYNASKLAFSPDGTLLATVTNTSVKLYSIKNRSFLSTLSIDWCSSLAFSPDCTRFATVSDSTVFLWDMRVIESSSPSSNQQNSSRLTAFALSWNCSRLACGFDDGAVELWETDDFQKRRIAAHRHHRSPIVTLGFSPDGRRFASGINDGTIILWDGEDGARRADLKCDSYPQVELSNSVLAAAGDCGISLWDCKTLERIHSFDGKFRTPLSFSTDGALLAAVSVKDEFHFSITVFDVISHTAFATFDTEDRYMGMMAFLPDNSQLLVLPRANDLIEFKVRFLTLNLVSKEVIRGPSFEKLIQLPDMPLWHGVPVWVNMKLGQFYLEALFSQHDDPVPVLWIPRELDVSLWNWVQGRSMIVIGCKGGRLVLLRLPTLSKKC